MSDHSLYFFHGIWRGTWWRLPILGSRGGPGGRERCFPWGLAGAVYRIQRYRMGRAMMRKSTAGDSGSRSIVSCQICPADGQRRQRTILSSSIEHRVRTSLLCYFADCLARSSGCHCGVTCLLLLVQNPSARFSATFLSQYWASTGTMCSKCSGTMAAVILHSPCRSQLQIVPTALKKTKTDR